MMAALRSRIELILSSSEPHTKREVERRLRSSYPELQFNKSLLTKVLRKHFQQLPPNHRFFPVPLWTTAEASRSVTAGSAAPSSSADELLEDEPDVLGQDDRPKTAEDARLQRERERRRQQVSGPTSLDLEGANYRKAMAADSPLQKVGNRALGRLNKDKTKYIDSD